MAIRIIQGDCRDVLKQLPAASVHCCVCSPPYYGLRDYGTAQWDGGDAGCDHVYDRTLGMRASTLGGGKANQPAASVYRDCPRCGARRIDAQIGLERTPDEYLSTMVAVFREVRRVLRDDGTLWLNIGDSYSSGARTTQCDPTESILGKVTARPDAANGGALRAPAGIAKPKDLLMMPARLALALQAPQHYGPIAKETDRAWLAAMMDGEGTISIARNVSARSNGHGEHCQPGYTPFVSMGNQDRELVDRCVEITGHGKSGLKDRPYIDSRQIVSRRDYYGWRIDARKAVEVIRDIYPFLIAKRKQTILAYNLSLSNDGGRALRGNGRLPQSEQEKREYLKLLINACNQRKPVDMPSWLIEPPSNFEQGWWLRSDIIWAKPNPMPESCTDRPTSAHEHVLLLSKSARYFYDADAVREQSVTTAEQWETKSANWRNGKAKQQQRGSTYHPYKDAKPFENGPNPAGRNLRNVWTIATSPFSAAHFATFPPELAERCIKAGTSERGCCAACGASWVRVTDRADTGRRQKMSDGWDTGDGGHGTVHRLGRQSGKAGIPVMVAITTGWSPSCRCNAEVVPATILDPFAGAFTAPMVADRLQRHAIGIELSEAYCTMARNRLVADAGMFAEVSP